MKKVILFFLLCFVAIGSMEATVLDVMCKIQRRCKETETDSLLIVRCGKPVFDYKSPDCCDTMDCGGITRSFIGIAYALLLEEGRIGTLDVPVHTFFPDRKGTACGSLTLHQLFSEGDDNSLNILGCAIEAISGKCLQDYLQAKLFTPMQMTQICRDERGHFIITPFDLAKIGQLIIEKGMWQGKTVLNRCSLHRLLSPCGQRTPFTGLLGTLEYYDIAFHWDEDLIKKYRSHGICSKIVNHLEGLSGRVIHFGGQVEGCKVIRLWGDELPCAFYSIHDFEHFLLQTQFHGLPMARFRVGGLKAVISRDKSGQELIVMPDRQLVVVRQKKHADKQCSRAESFDDLCELLDLYARECDCWID